MKTRTKKATTKKVVIESPEKFEFDYKSKNYYAFKSYMYAERYVLDLIRSKNKDALEILDFLLESEIKTQESIREDIFNLLHKAMSHITHGQQIVQEAIYEQRQITVPPVRGIRPLTLEAPAVKVQDYGKLLTSLTERKDEPSRIIQLGNYKAL
jgi:hypothetical protein